MIEQREHFEQEATKATEMESVLCFLGYLLLNLVAAAFAPMTRISFRVFRVFRGVFGGRRVLCRIPTFPRSHLR